MDFFIKSTIPYSLVESLKVYNGSNKNVINCVQNLPTIKITEFFINSLFFTFMYYSSTTNISSTSFLQLIGT